MDELPKLLTRQEMSRSLHLRLGEIWRPYKLREETLGRYTQYFASGIPLDYLDLDLEDYRSIDRSPLDPVLAFIGSLEYQWRSQGGLLLLGPNGAGKSFLSYMIAQQAIGLGLQTVCFSPLDYLTRRRLERTQPSLILELLKQVEESKLVVVDDLGKEQGRGDRMSDYDALLLAQYMYSLFSSGFARAYVFNSAMIKDDLFAYLGSSVVSRISRYPVVPVKGEDFRVFLDDEPENILNFRAQRTDFPCWKAHPILLEQNIKAIGEACQACKYRLRPKLCYLRATHRGRGGG